MSVVLPTPAPRRPIGDPQVPVPDSDAQPVPAFGSLPPNSHSARGGPAVTASVPAASPAPPPRSPPPRSPPPQQPVTRRDRRTPRCEALQDFFMQLNQCSAVLRELGPSCKLGQAAGAGANELPGCPVLLFRRQLLISIVAAWDTFLQDVITEAARTVIGDARTLPDLEARWPQCWPVLAPVLDVHSSDAKQQGENLRALLLDLPAAWLAKVDEVIARMMHNPTLGSLDDCVERVFKFGKISTILCQAANPLVFNNSVKNHSVSCTNVQAVGRYLGVLYGARCAYAHGNCKRTLSKGGVVGDFPTDSASSALDLGDPGYATWMVDMVENLRRKGSDANLNHWSLVNAIFFLQALARRVCECLSTRFSEQGIEMWVPTIRSAPAGPSAGEGDQAEGLRGVFGEDAA